MADTDKNSCEARAKLMRARTSLVLDHPFFASLALRLGLKEDRGCHTAWTDGKVFGYNPNYINILSHEKLVGLAAHTVMHPACGHHKRRGSRDKATWNRACDYVINPILLEAGLTLPDGFLWDSAHAGKSAEKVYASLREADDKDTQETDNPEQEAEPSQNPEKGEEAQGEAGDSRAAEEMAQDPEEADPGMSGEVRDGDDTPDDAAPGREENETDWDQALVQAAANARAMGKLPKGVDIFVEERFSPKLPWNQLLARFIRQSARQDYSWTQPNRRYIHQDLYFPALVSDQLPELAVAVDTSGSIQPLELEAFGGELSAILSMNPSLVHLIYSDMDVNRYETVAPWDLPLDFSPKGGGGTDFRQVFQFIEDRYIRPFCLIFFSDMECRLFPQTAPDYPVLWVRTGQGGVLPPFGQMVDLEIERINQSA